VSNIYAVVNVDEADIGLVRQLAPESARSGRAATQPEVDAYGVPTTNAASLPEGVIDTTKEVEITVESFPNERFGGMIERIAPQSEVSAAIATFRVWIRLSSPNKSELVRQLNTQAEAHFTAKSVRDALLVSYDAFQKNPNGDGFGVYVPIPTIKDGKKYEFRPCEFGRDNGIDVQVVKGLKEGDIVYTKLPQMSAKEQKAANAD
jgi:multidrug efflux pump subunit AcrA (membrane-fusion protein)